MEKYSNIIRSTSHTMNRDRLIGGREENAYRYINYVKGL